MAERRSRRSARPSTGRTPPCSARPRPEHLAAGPEHPQDYQLVARHSGKCVDVSGISTAARAPVHQWTCTRRSGADDHA
ncbi:RICIN domain-containing protein [Nonomuraea guangzhouensis]|uniref:RICIN domain-containing protein n=1 Tax=Nonomuraea guangzhouensis TaxID=1291555 RepID=A0ABW4G8F4_9ACTN